MSASNQYCMNALIVLRVGALLQVRATYLLVSHIDCRIQIGFCHLENLLFPVFLAGTDRNDSCLHVCPYRSLCNTVRFKRLRSIDDPGAIDFVL